MGVYANQGKLRIHLELIFVRTYLGKKKPVLKIIFLSQIFLSQYCVQKCLVWHVP
jgi:hypothetical protein